MSAARTPHGKRRVSARRGRAGERSDFFSLLLEQLGGIIEMGQRLAEGTMH